MLRTSSWPIKLAAGVAVLTVGAVGYIAVNSLDHNASADTENCATHGEYDQTDVFMSPSTVESIYDVYGQYVDTPNEDTFARTYRTCWAADTREIIVRYDQASALSINWDVRDK
jgi:hypothetical protein